MRNAPQTTNQPQTLAHSHPCQNRQKQIDFLILRYGLLGQTFAFVGLFVIIHTWWRSLIKHFGLIRNGVLLYYAVVAESKWKSVAIEWASLNGILFGFNVCTFVFMSTHRRRLEVSKSIFFFFFWCCHLMCKSM